MYFKWMFTCQEQLYCLALSVACDYVFRLCVDFCFNLSTDLLAQSNDGFPASGKESSLLFWFAYTISQYSTLKN